MRQKIHKAEHAMAGHHNARIGRKVAIAALFACLTAAPVLAQDVPLPTPAPGGGQG